jgi:hypothetical protein
MRLSLTAMTITLAKASFNEFNQKANEFGFIAEKHEFKTNDAYFLSVGRLPPLVPKSQPVLLLPDIFMSMDSWLVHATTAS